MEASQSLLTGKDFERLIFGEALAQEYATRGFYPKEFRYNSSLQYIIRKNWQSYAEALERGEESFHNPTHPTSGKTQDIWSAVRRYLPRRMQGHGALPLNLYIAVGRTSLDWMYGIDAFFWWQGGFVSFDVTLQPKHMLGTLKADFVFGPNELTPKGLDDFGKSVAMLLRRRSNRARREESHREETAEIRLYNEEEM